MIGLDAGAGVTDALYDAGFASSGRFYASSTDRLGMTPSEFRAGGDGVDVRFAVGECWLGAILVAATDRGVCAIELGDDPDALVRALQDRFHAARLVGDDPAFDALVARAVALVEAPASADDLPLDVRGTAFQERVWRALRALPAGSTVSYAELAERIGSPRSVRAVAGACAANHVAVAIPCHRVVRTDGSLSGYRWGVDRKAALLAREGAEHHATAVSARRATARPAVAHDDTVDQGPAIRGSATARTGASSTGSDLTRLRSAAHGSRGRRAVRTAHRRPTSHVS